MLTLLKIRFFFPSHLQGGFDSGYLYHCKFSEDQEEDPDNQWDEPFHYVPIENSDTDPIRSVTFRYRACKSFTHNNLIN